MSDYLVRITGHIDENKRPRGVSKDFPQGFPQWVREDTYIQVQQAQGVMKHIADEVTKYVRVQGMWVRKNPDLQQDANKLENEDRMFIPMHMITHITSAFQILNAEIPMVDEGGRVFFPSGKNVTVS
jgi:hypothetical protein